MRRGVAKQHASKLLKKQVGSVLQGGGYVIVDIRAEAYEPMPGLTQLVKIAVMHSSENGEPSLTKKAWEKKVNYRRSN